MLWKWIRGLGLFLCCVLLYSEVVVGAEIVIVVSGSFKPYLETQKGFEEICREKTKVFIFEGKPKNYDQKSINKALNYIRDNNPPLICVIGTQALTAVLPVTSKTTPVVTSAVKNPELWAKDYLSNGHQVYGVNLFVSSDLVIKTIRSTYPNVKTIGIAYLEISTNLIEELSTEAEKQGLTIHAELADPRNPLPATEAISADSDLFLIVDNSMIGETSFDALLLSRKPIVSLVKSPLLVSKGALFGFRAQFKENGRRAGEIANILLDGKPVKQKFPKMQKVSLLINKKVSEQIGKPLPTGFEIEREYKEIKR